ncbi:hypothetical protein V5799_002905 [Amblyomma americanum]|uniref:Uncharacterized protein n=1 Tax=Amblyomma americanum TaxID=6943 RepID=A0AAQ4DAH3_AMBAM
MNRWLFRGVLLNSAQQDSAEEPPIHCYGSVLRAGLTSVHFHPRREEARLEGRNTSFGLCGHKMEAGGANNGASTLSRGAHRFGVAWCHPLELKEEALQRDRNMEAGSGSDRDVAIPALGNDRFFAHP